MEYEYQIFSEARSEMLSINNRKTLANTRMQVFDFLCMHYACILSLVCIKHSLDINKHSKS